MAAEDFEGGVCGGNWPWNSSRNLFASSPCSLDTFGWTNIHDVIPVEMQAAARSSDDSTGSASDGSGSVVVQKPPPPGFEMMGISTDWNQDLLNDSGRSEQNYSNLVIMNSNMNNNYEQQINSSLINTTTTTCLIPNNISTTTIDGLSTGFPLNSASYSLLQNLFDDIETQPQQSSLINYPANSNGFLPNNHLPLWNATPQSHNFLPSSKMPKHQNEEGSRQVAKKGSNESFKRPRIETPSPLPTFKVRKEKLGDRITALQQLVSPFGKTDTASVLHEAIEYIKFLHDQVNALSTPYLKYGSPPLQRQQGGDKAKDGEGLLKDLNSRGLCLVPISSTFPVAAETPSDFWTPTFGGNLK